MPRNYSEQAKEIFEQELELQDELHPYGVFWYYDDEGKLKINRERLYQVCNGIGLRNFNQDAVILIDNVIHRLTENECFNKMKDYIKEEDASQYEDICNVFETFLQNSGKFTISRYHQLNKEDILNDELTCSYKFFNNCIVKVTPHSINKITYDDNKKYIWAEKIMPREWSDGYPDTCKYTEYLHHAIGFTNDLVKIIGYLSHDYKDENTGYIIVCTERCPDPKQGGGSGKNLFGLLLKNTTSVYSMPAEQVQFNEKLLQSWQYERIMMISDLPKKFNIGWFKDISTGYIQRKRLFKNEETITPYDAPKYLLNTNFSYDVSDGGLARRIIPIEFTDFFTRCGGVKKHFGGLFPVSPHAHSIWTKEDWIGYDWTIAKGLQTYLMDSDLEADKLSSGGWEKQFKLQYGQHTHEFIQENFESWASRVYVETSVFNSEYASFCRDSNIKDGLSGITMNNALKSFCERASIEFNGNKQHSITKKKCKYFGEKIENLE